MIAGILREGPKVNRSKLSWDGSGMYSRKLSPLQALHEEELR